MIKLVLSFIILIRRRLLKTLIRTLKVILSLILLLILYILLLVRIFFFKDALVSTLTEIWLLSREFIKFRVIVLLSDVIAAFSGFFSVLGHMRWNIMLKALWVKLFLMVRQWAWILQWLVPVYVEFFGILLISLLLIIGRYIWDKGYWVRILLGKI